MPLLPSTMTSPPSFRKNNPADDPIMFLAVTSRTVPTSVLDDYAENVIAPRISMVSGVSQVDVMGEQKYAVRLQVDPDQLRSNQIGLNEYDQALQNRNVNVQTGQQLPPSARLGLRRDRSKNIREAFGDIQWTMLITLVLVVGVIFAFLHNGSATMIPALALPFSILGTFAVMKVLHFSLNNLSMMAL